MSLQGTYRVGWCSKPKDLKPPGRGQRSGRSQAGPDYKQWLVSTPRRIDHRTFAAWRHGEPMLTMAEAQIWGLWEWNEMEMRWKWDSRQAKGLSLLTYQRASRKTMINTPIGTRSPIRSFSSIIKKMWSLMVSKLVSLGRGGKKSYVRGE